MESNASSPTAVRSAAVHADTDVGRSLELYAEFSRSGATYVPFPDVRSHRIAL